jgi:multicomponent Na+:H+ antiporter subunit D
MADLLALPWIVMVVALPLTAATVAALPGRRLTLATALAAAALTPVAATLLALQVADAGVARHAPGGWGAPLGILLVADGLAALMVLAAALVMAAASLHALAHPGAFYGTPGNRSFFWPVWLFLWAALNALFVSADVFNLYVTLELLTLAAVILAALSQKPEALIAAMRYLLAALLGSLAYLLGVALLYGMGGALDLATLGQRLRPGPGVQIAAALVTVGLLLKTALFPFHFWLPQAHANAAAPVSAVLSALVVKASFYILLRLWQGPFAGLLGPVPGQLLGLLGAAAVLFGSLQALRQQRLKLVVAYSTVAQLGYLFLLFPLAPGPGAAEAFQAVVLHLLAHAFAKAAAFLAAGNFHLVLGHDRLAGLTGLRGRLGMSLFAFALAATSLMGLPPSGGFVAKWRLLEAALKGGQWWWAAVILAGSAQAALYLFRILRTGLIEKVPEGDDSRAVPRVMERAALALALLAIALGLLAALPLGLLATPAPALPR